MKHKELKKTIYLDALEQSIVSVEMVINHLKQIDLSNKEIPEEYLQKDKMETILSLELSLAGYCILLRKMKENCMIELTMSTTREMNAIIHSNRFEYSQDNILVFSQRGSVNVNLNSLLDCGRQIINREN